MSDNTIKEFLVGLGVRVDENAVRKFVSGIEGITGKVLGMGTAVAFAAGASVEALHRMADGFEKLYYNAQLSGDSIKNIKALGFGVQQFGGSLEKVNSEFANFAEQLQRNPALKSFLNGLGVNTNQDTTSVFADYVKRLNAMPENWRKLAYANGTAIQISRETLQAFQNGAQTQIDVYKKMADSFGVNLDKMGRDSAEFERMYRTMAQGIEFGWDIIKGNLISGANYIANSFQPVLDAIAELNKALGKTDDQTSIWKETTSELKLVVDFMAGLLRTAVDMATLFNRLIHGDWQGVKAAWKDMNEADAAFIQSWKTQNSPDTPGAASNAGSAGGTGGAASAIKFLQGMGLSAAQATGVVANLVRESGLNPNATGDNGQAYGIQQLHPNRQARFAQLMGKPVQGSSVEEQLTFLVREMREGMESTAWNVLQNAQDPQSAARAFSLFNERPADAYGEAARRAAIASSLSGGAPSFGNGVNGSMSMHMDTKIIVNGSGDPNVAANMVQQNQSRVYGDATRNFVSAVGRRGTQ